MTTLTSTATLVIANAAIAIDSISLTVLPVPATGTGRGRLVHPTFGSYDYERPPDEWEGIRGDAIISPIWASTKTLLGAANTLFVGDLRDVIVEERWTQSLVGSSSFVDALIAMWQNPPDPSVAYVQWFPNYCSAESFNVVLLGLTLGSKGITTATVSKQQRERGPMVLRMRICGRL